MVVSLKTFDLNAAQEWVIDTKLHLFGTKPKANSYSEELTHSDYQVPISSWLSLEFYVMFEIRPSFTKSMEPTLWSLRKRVSLYLKLMHYESRFKASAFDDTGTIGEYKQSIYIGNVRTKALRSSYANFMTCFCERSVAWDKHGRQTHQINYPIK